MCFQSCRSTCQKRGWRGWGRHSQVICQTRTNRSEEVGMPLLLLFPFISFCTKKQKKNSLPSASVSLSRNKTTKEKYFAGCDPARCGRRGRVVSSCVVMEDGSSYSSSPSSSSSRSSSAEPDLCRLRCNFASQSHNSGVGQHQLVVLLQPVLSGTSRRRPGPAVGFVLLKKIQ